jgi:uncharacterized phosphatase
MKEFYFIRHGQTDYNIRLDHDKIEHPPHVPLNATGRAQAIAVEPIITDLPIKTICCSPYLRAQETKELITSKRTVNVIDMDDLGECNSLVWREMTSKQKSEVSHRFLEKVKKGLDAALENEGPVLIVAHGGVHWAICDLLNIEGHHWAVDNCVPIHFSLTENAWKARPLV